MLIIFNLLFYYLPGLKLNYKNFWATYLYVNLILKIYKVSEMFEIILTLFLVLLVYGGYAIYRPYKLMKNYTKQL